jgi:HEAT repeat protein
VLEEILLDHVQRVRGVEHERLSAALDELGFTDASIRRLRGRRWWQRAEAAEKLGLARAKRAVPWLAAALADDSVEVRMRAAKALGGMGSDAPARDLMRALDQPNRWSTIRIADILTGMGRDVIDDLVSTFPELSLAGRLAALDIVARIAPLHVVPWLLGRLRDPNVDVRARACNALGCIGDPEVTPAVLAALEDAAWPVRAMAAKALGRINNPGAIPALALALRDSEWWVRSNAARALRAMGSRGLAALEEALDDPDRFARHQAILMLQEAGVVDGHAEGLTLADDESRSVAERFLRRLIASGQTQHLSALAAEHPHGEVRRALKAILSSGPPGLEAPQ